MQTKPDYEKLLADDPRLLERYDLNRNGVIDDDELALFIRLVENESKYRQKRLNPGHFIMLDTERRIRNYDVLGLLGRGGQATTFLCRDSEQNYLVLKERSFAEVQDWKSVELFEREADILAKLTHTSIPRYFDDFRIEDADGVRLYIGQSFVQGDNLEDKLAASGAFSTDQVQDFVSQLCDVLRYLHDRPVPIIHRDIKPSNIICDPDGQYHLIDFGSVQISNKAAGGSTVTGTFGYAPLEQFMGRAVPGSDVYSLGVTILELLTGAPPFDWKIESGRVDLSSFTLNSTIRERIASMLEPFPEQRPSLDVVQGWQWSPVSNHTARPEGQIVFRPNKLWESPPITAVALRQPTDALIEFDLTGSRASVSSSGVVYDAMNGDHENTTIAPKPALIGGALLLLLFAIKLPLSSFLVATTIIFITGITGFMMFHRPKKRRVLELQDGTLRLQSSLLMSDDQSYFWDSISSDGPHVIVEYNSTLNFINVGSPQIAARLADHAQQLSERGVIEYQRVD